MEQSYLMPGQERWESFRDANGVPKVRYSYCSLKGRLFRCVSCSREEAERLEAEFAQGLHTEEAYRSLREDLERRAVEEMRETETTKSRVAPVSLRNAVIGVVALMVCVPVMCYQLLGAPEVMLLVKDQQVFQGEARDVEQIREYLKVNEKDARAWVLLARRSVEQEDYRTALDAYRKGRSLNEKVAADPEVMLELTATILTLNERSAFPEAKELVRKALGVDPESPRTLEMAAIVMLTAEDWNRCSPSRVLTRRSICALRNSFARRRKRRPGNRKPVPAEESLFGAGAPIDALGDARRSENRPSSLVRDGSADCEDVFSRTRALPAFPGKGAVGRRLR